MNGNLKRREEVGEIERKEEVRPTISSCTENWGRVDEIRGEMR